MRRKRPADRRFRQRRPRRAGGGGRRAGTGAAGPPHSLQAPEGQGSGNARCAPLAPILGPGGSRAKAARGPRPGSACRKAHCTGRGLTPGSVIRGRRRSQPRPLAAFESARCADRCRQLAHFPHEPVQNHILITGFLSRPVPFLPHMSFVPGTDASERHWTGDVEHRRRGVGLHSFLYWRRRGTSWFRRSTLRRVEAARAPRRILILLFYSSHALRAPGARVLRNSSFTGTLKSADPRSKVRAGGPQFECSQRD